MELILGVGFGEVDVVEYHGAFLVALQCIAQRRVGVFLLEAVEQLAFALVGKPAVVDGIYLVVVRVEAIAVQVEACGLHVVLLCDYAPNIGQGLVGQGLVGVRVGKVGQLGSGVQRGILQHEQVVQCVAHLLAFVARRVLAQESLVGGYGVAACGLRESQTALFALGGAEHRGAGGVERCHRVDGVGLVDTVEQSGGHLAKHLLGLGSLVGAGVGGNNMVERLGCGGLHVGLEHLAYAPLAHQVDNLLVVGEHIEVGIKVDHVEVVVQPDVVQSRVAYRRLQVLHGGQQYAAPQQPRQLAVLVDTHQLQIVVLGFSGEHHGHRQVAHRQRVVEIEHRHVEQRIHILGRLCISLHDALEANLGTNGVAGRRLGSHRHNH